MVFESVVFFLYVGNISSLVLVFVEFGVWDGKDEVVDVGSYFIFLFFWIFVDGDVVLLVNC